MWKYSFRQERWQQENEGDNRSRKGDEEVAGGEDDGW